MFSHQFFCTSCRQYRFAIQRFALLAFIGVLCVCLDLHSQAVRANVKAAALLGQVTQSGVPVGSATVKAYEEVIKGGHLQLEMKCAGRTTREGQYSCGGLTAGRYYLYVQIQSRSSRSPSNSPGLTPAFGFYYQAADLADAGTVTVRESQTQVIQIELGSHPVFTVSGEVPARPKALSLSLQSLGRGSESIPVGLIPSYDPARGVFTFRGVPPGQYSLLALWHDAEREHSSQVAVTVTDEDVVDLQVPDTGGAHLALKLQPCEAGAPAIPELYLNRADGSLLSSTKIALASPGNTNQFDFTDIPSGQYLVGLVGGKSAYIEGTSLAPQGAGNLVNVPDGGGSLTAEVQMRCRASSLAGRIDMEDEDDGRVYVVLRSTLTGETYQRDVDGNSDFTFDGLAPGEYSIYAIPANDQSDQASDSLVNDTGATSVTLEPNNTSKVVVPLAQ